MRLMNIIEKKYLEKRLNGSLEEIITQTLSNATPLYIYIYI